MTSTEKSSTMSSFIPTAAAVIVGVDRRTTPAQRNGHKWWSGNTTHAASVKVILNTHDNNPTKNTSNDYALILDGSPVVGKWRIFQRNYPNGRILVADYRGIMKEEKTMGHQALAEQLANDPLMPLHRIYHERPAIIPAYDTIYTDYAQEGWVEGRVYYYGVRADIAPDNRYSATHDAQIHGFHTRTTMSVSHTPSALTPKRAFQVYANNEFHLPYEDVIEFVEKGKAVGSWTAGRYTDADARLKRDWIKGVRCASIRVVKHWRETTTSIPMPNLKFVDAVERYCVPDGGVLMTDISSKNITDTPMNPFGEGSVAKNRIPMTDGLSYITDTPDAVSQFALGMARRNYLFKKELMEAVLHPDRVAKMVEKYGIEWVEV